MSFRLSRRLCISFLLLLSVPEVGAQNVPSDLEIIATAGSLTPDSEYRTVRISSNGSGTYGRFLPTGPATPALETLEFSLTPIELESVWEAIEANGFHGLDELHVDETLMDGTFAELIVTADGSTHTVRTRNTALSAFDAIMSVINDATPGNADLIYDMSAAFTFTPIDVCERLGKSGTASGHGKHAHPVEDHRSPVDPVLSFSEDDHPPHPGTVVACNQSLDEAVEDGIITMTGKGGYFGDTISMTVDNSAGGTLSAVTLTLYLELWGSAADAETSDSIENAIESTWGGRVTSTGAPFVVDVRTRTAMDASEAPGTEGYHQIMLLFSSNFISNVRGRGSDFDVNRGVGTGTWSTTHPNPTKLYSHESGHLFGLPDQYIDYRKQDETSWERRNDGEVFTPNELLDEIAPKFPDSSDEEIADWLDSGIRRITHPKDGFENNLMATLDGVVEQRDIDEIAIQKEDGLLVRVTAGDVLLNRELFQQNMVVTRNQDVYVPSGEERTLNGIYAACIDHDRGIPSEGAGFDVAPSLSEWSGIESAALLQNLSSHIDRNELYCDSDIETQLAVWRVTDNSEVGNETVDAILADAGIVLGGRLLDFPKMSNSGDSGSETGTVTPPQLFVASVETAPDDLVEIGETVSLTSDLHAPSLDGVTTESSWLLLPPSGSETSLTSTEGESTSFTADLRGHYQVQLLTQISGVYSLPFNVTESFLVTAADDRTETFENGSLETGPPFFWDEISNTPWAITDDVSGTGRHAAVTADIGNLESSSLRSRFIQSEAEPFSFSVKVISELDLDVLELRIDGELVNTWSGNMTWTPYSVDLAPGDHTVTWTYSKDESYSEGADRAWIDDVFFPQSAVFTAIERFVDDEVPHDHGLQQNYPNPFERSTTITYSLPEAEHVRLVVYDVQGRRVATLADGVRQPGRYQVTFDKKDLSDGLYFYVLTAGAFSDRKAMVVVE